MAKSNLEHILDFKKIHSDKYNYSLINEKILVKNKIKIICNKCGNIFEQQVLSHKSGSGCPYCFGNKNLTNDIFIKKALKKHNYKYDYNKVNYSNSKTKVIIICPEHGEFLQTPYEHTKGIGCPKCGIIKRSSSRIKKQEEIIKRFKEVHGNRYNYGKVKYIKNNKKVIIICKKCGNNFLQTPNNHQNGQGCPFCDISRKKSQIEHINDFEKVHFNKYNYSKVKYKNPTSKVKIYCNSCEKYFLQTPNNHKSGSGCPNCYNSKGENNIKIFLEKNKYSFFKEYKFNDCIYMDKNNPLKFDFYLPESNILIEYDGEQHFKPVKYFGGEEEFLKIQKRDTIKNEYCKNNNIKLIRIPYTDFNKIEEILKEKLNE